MLMFCPRPQLVGRAATIHLGATEVDPNLWPAPTVLGLVMVVSENRAQGFAIPDIEVEFGPVPAFAAVVKLRGEHDIAASERLREVLAPILGNVLVDLSDCAFVDSSVIAALVLDSRERARERQRLELLVPAANATIARTLELCRVTEVLTVHRALEFN
jgi:anti-anti-sigma factor